MLNAISSNLALSCVHPIAGEKKVKMVVSSPSTAKGTKINVPLGESNTGALDTQCSLTVALVDPAKLVPHAFSDMPLIDHVAQVLGIALSETRESVEDAATVHVSVLLCALSKRAR